MGGRSRLFQGRDILWMDELLHHFATMVEAIVCWHLPEESTHSRVSERWCGAGFRNHPQNFAGGNDLDVDGLDHFSGSRVPGR